MAPFSFCITVCPTCCLSDHLGIMLGCPCLTVGLMAAGSPSICTMAGKGSCCSTCRSQKDMASMQSSPFLRSAGNLAQQQELWSVSPLSFFEKALQAKCTAAVACSSITINASFVTLSDQAERTRQVAVSRNLWGTLTPQAKKLRAERRAFHAGKQRPSVNATS